MASFDCSGIDGLILSLQEIAALPEDVQDEILNAQADVLVEAQKDKARAYGVERSGMMVSSIGKSKPKRKKDSRVIHVFPKGKNAQGVRNAEIGFINNYGRRKQSARPFVTDANAAAEGDMVQAGERVFDEWLKSKE